MHTILGQSYSQEINLRHTPNDDIALVELTQIGDDGNGEQVEHTMVLSSMQARALRDSLSALLANEDQKNLNSLLVGKKLWE